MVGHCRQHTFIQSIAEGNLWDTVSGEIRSSHQWPRVLTIASNPYNSSTTPTRTWRFDDGQPAEVKRGRCRCVKRRGKQFRHDELYIRCRRPRNKIARQRYTTSPALLTSFGHASNDCRKPNGSTLAGMVLVLAWHAELDFTDIIHHWMGWNVIYWTALISGPN